MNEMNDPMRPPQEEARPTKDESTEAADTPVHEHGHPQGQPAFETESGASTRPRPETHPDETRPQPPAAEAGMDMPPRHGEPMSPGDSRETATTAGAPESESAGLLPWHEADGYRRQWESVQACFVDDPREAIERADALVVDVLRRMAQVREEHRGRLRSSVGDSSSTEDLLGTMRSYRALFDGLLRT